jgi:hypothetical protein
MADSPAKASSTTPEPDICVLGNEGASEAASDVLSVEQVQNRQVVAADAQHTAAAHKAPETLIVSALGVNNEASVGKSRVARGAHVGAVDHETSPIAELTDDRLANSSTGRDVRSEAPQALLTLPSETALLVLGRQMLTGGTGTPAAPATCFEPAEATPALLVLVWSVVAKLKKEHSQEFHLVPGTNGRIDAEESRGYLLGAVLGRGLLERTQAAAAGLDARNKKAAVEKRLGAEKEAARKAARKLSGAELERHTAAAAEERAALERAPIPLQLPPPLMPPPPPKPQSATGRKRAPPEPPEPRDPLQMRFEAWCRRHPCDMPNPVEYHEDLRKYRRMRKAFEWRAWHPRGYAERAQLTRTRALQQRSNQVCCCNRGELVGQPSFLCRAHLCYAFEVGTCDGIGWSNHPSDRMECDCMQHAWAGDDEMPRWPAHKPMLLLEREQYMGWEPSLSFSWLDPPPGGRYGPSFVPAAAAHKLTRADLRMMEPDPVDGWRESDLRKYPSYGKV